MKYLYLLFFSLLTISGFSQFEVGHTTITFNDPGRTGGFGSGGGAGRQIQTEIYYPADVAGQDVSVTVGAFPVVVFGHGFFMAWDAYENIWEALVAEGYIVAFPRTEGGVTPSHDDFGQDLALVAAELQNEGANTGSLFFERTLDRTAIVGHSMGGGATILAAENNNSIQTIVGLAPAETNPSAITAAQNVSVPSLIFSADEDAVTPPADHHVPIYNAITASCKYFVNILGGAHCYYANSNFNCDFGETTSGGNITISRAEQQTIMFTYLIPWLDIYLKDDCSQNSVFEVDLPIDVAVTDSSTCTGFPSLNYDLNVSSDGATLTSASVGAIYQWVDCTTSYSFISGANNQNFTPINPGDYAVILGTGDCADTSACVSIQSASIAETQEPSLLIYPNPSQGSFDVTTTTAGKYTIHSAAGDRVAEGLLSQGVNSIEHHLKPGLYLFRSTADKQVQTVRLIIQ